MTTPVPAISRADIAQTLSKIRELSAQSKPSELSLPQTKPTSQFDGVLNLVKKGINTINATQNSADGLKNAYLNGDPKVSLPQVLMTSIQSKVAFEGLLVVRNKLIDAYKEVMNMSV